MSRAGNLVGSFVIEDRTGDVRRPWTAEDAARLAGTFTIGGRATKPHVMTPSGPYIAGVVAEQRADARAGQAEQRCPKCGAAKMVRKLFARSRVGGSAESLEGPWCYGCGRGS